MSHVLRTVAVVQARMSSTRFPGKVLADLGGKPMLAHIIERLQLAEMLDQVVVATTDRSEDDAVADFASACGALVDPELVDRLVRVRAAADAEYASNVLEPSYPEGYDAEVLTAECLRRIDVESTLDYEREHVTPRIREHPDEYRTAQLRNDRDLTWIRLTVDVPADLERVRTILDALPSSPPPDLGAVVAYFEGHAELWDQRHLPARNERYLAQRAAAQGRRPPG
jgi:spore coat polysaccharide biosynthesis protein SpsF (cytidylyltransferase family)